MKQNKGIYMHCSTKICKADSHHPLCSFGCEATPSDRKHRRMLNHKGYASDDDVYTVSSGFIELNKPSNKAAIEFEKQGN